MSSAFGRPLPSRPDLAQQKKLAKELLQSFASGDAESRARVRSVLPDKQQIALADAQFVLAREYGFSNWAALKQQIESSAEATASPEERIYDAFRRRDANAVRILFERHAELRERINEPLFSFDSPAIVAFAGDPAIVDVLLHFGADPNRRSDWWAGGFHALYSATGATVDKLIAAGAIPDACAAAHINRPDLLARMIADDPARVHERGGDGRLVAYTSTQAHSSVEKAVKITGLGRENLRLIEVDGRFGMNAQALKRQITQDRDAGLKPCFVCATVGTTSSNAFDPLPEIGRICREQGVWLHVDAAMSGTAALCPEFRHIHQGLELADSYAFNPHKWMFTNFDCDCFYVADRSVLIQTLSVLPEYLRNQATESGAVIDYRDWQIPLGRRFRALKLWFVIRHYGIEGLRYHIRRHVARGKRELISLQTDKVAARSQPIADHFPRRCQTWFVNGTRSHLDVTSSIQ